MEWNMFNCTKSYERWINPTDAVWDWSLSLFRHMRIKIYLSYERYRFSVNSTLEASSWTRPGPLSINRVNHWRQSRILCYAATPEHACWEVAAQQGYSWRHWITWFMDIPLVCLYEVWSFARELNFPRNFSSRFLLSRSCLQRTMKM